MINFLYRIFGVDDWVIFYATLSNNETDNTSTLYHIEYSKIRNIFRLKVISGYNAKELASMTSNVITLNHYILLGRDIKYIINNFIFNNSYLMVK